jgi:hypothetical protein
MKVRDAYSKVEKDNASAVAPPSKMEEIFSTTFGHIAVADKICASLSAWQWRSLQRGVAAADKFHLRLDATPPRELGAHIVRAPSGGTSCLDVPLWSDPLPERCFDAPNKHYRKDTTKSDAITHGFILIIIMGKEKRINYNICVPCTLCSNQRCNLPCRFGSVLLLRLFLDSSFDIGSTYRERRNSRNEWINQGYRHQDTPVGTVQ